MSTGHEQGVDLAELWDAGQHLDTGAALVHAGRAEDRRLMTNSIGVVAWAFDVPHVAVGDLTISLDCVLGGGGEVTLEQTVPLG